MFQVSPKKWSDLQGKSATWGRLNSLRTALDIATGGEAPEPADVGAVLMRVLTTDERDHLLSLLAAKATIDSPGALNSCRWTVMAIVLEFKAEPEAGAKGSTFARAGFLLTTLKKSLLLEPWQSSLTSAAAGVSAITSPFHAAVAELQPSSKKIVGSTTEVATSVSLKGWTDTAAAGTEYIQAVSQIALK